jgi:hypothetical protein
MNTLDEKLWMISQRRAAAYSEERYKEFEAELNAFYLEAQDDDQRFSATSMLADHYHQTKADGRALAAIRQSITIFPERVEAWLALAEHFHYYQINLDEAASAIEVALQKAIVENCQVRQVLGVRIRIALERGEYGVVNDSLARLVEYKVPKGGFDVALERDFVSRIPEQTVDEKLLRQYEALLAT